MHGEHDVPINGDGFGKILHGQLHQRWDKLVGNFQNCGSIIGEKMEQQGFTQDQIAAIVGTKELELIALRMQLAAVAAERDALKAKYEPQPEAKAELKAVT